MLKIYRQLVLLGVMLSLSSCSLFKSGQTDSTVSVDDLLREDIVASGQSSAEKLSAKTNEGEDDLSLEGGKEDLSLEEDLEEQSPSDGELSLEEDEVSESLVGNSEEETDDNFREGESAEEITGVDTVLQSEEKSSNLKSTLLEGITYSQQGQVELLSISAQDKIEYSTRFNRKNNQFIIEVKNAVLAEKLKRPYFMKDFAGGSVIAVNSYQESPSGTANIVLQLRNGVNSPPQITNLGSSLELSYPLAPGQLGQNKFSQNLAGGSNIPAGSASATSVKGQGQIKEGALADFFLGGGSYYGKPISLQFEEVGVRQVINYIASEVGANILVDDKVQGKISLKLRNIPWDQALALVLKSKGLGYIKEKGGVLRISSLNNLKAEEEALVAIIKSKRKLTPLLVRVLPISFAKATDLSSKLKVFLTPTRGAISADARSNTLIITDTPDILKKISLLVKSLDRAPSQVSIEAKFIEANQSFSKNLGVNWGFTGGSIDINGLSGTSGPISIGLGAGGVKPVSADSLKGLAGSIGFTLGSFKFLGDLSSILAIAEQDQMVKVISTPTVVVLDKQKASITNKGENLSIERSDSDGTVTESIKRTPIKLQLDVSPQIAADGNILLDVNIIREFAGGSISSNNARPINSRNVKTKVLIKNGSTLVVGGIFQKDTTAGYSGVPFLSKLPLFGWLFKYQSDDESKNELMVFLTPKIL